MAGHKASRFGTDRRLRLHRWRYGTQLLSGPRRAHPGKRKPSRIAQFATSTLFSFMADATSMTTGCLTARNAPEAENHHLTGPHRVLVVSADSTSRPATPTDG